MAMNQNENSNLIQLFNKFIYEAIDIIFNPFNANNLFSFITPLCMTILNKC